MAISNALHKVMFALEIKLHRSTNYYFQRYRFEAIVLLINFARLNLKMKQFYFVTWTNLPHIITTALIVRS